MDEYLEKYGEGLTAVMERIRWMIHESVEEGPAIE